MNPEERYYAKNGYKAILISTIVDLVSYSFYFPRL